MTKPECSVLITDLDNTLWDWFEVWFASFSALLAETHRISGIPIAQLETEIKVVHERHRTSEYSFILEELPSLQALHPGGDIRTIYGEAIHAHRSARKAHLKLYPGVQEVLELARREGAILVGYTESMAFYTSDRMRRTGLDSLLDFLYSAPDHELPAGLSPEQVRLFPKEHYELARTVHRHTPHGATKPNPDVLRQIVSDIGISPDEAIYVGDDLAKDVLMAQQAGVRDVWAKYGVAHRREEYEQLKRVTHWPQTAVARQSALKAEDVKPTYAINGFGNLADLFSFRRPAAAGS